MANKDTQHDPGPEPIEELIGRLREQPESRRYDVRGEVARGGMGSILRVWDSDLRRTSAMKVMLADDGSRTPDPKVLGRFLEEAQITGQLDHPGVVPVHELGLDAQGRVFFTMRLVDGRDLEQVFGLVKSGTEGWNTARALGVLLKVCEAMAYAHSKGVIHRDLKPANIMVGRFGEVYVMDWGLAKVLANEGAAGADPAPAMAVDTARAAKAKDPTTGFATLDGTIVGTPAYMPPEQAHGKIGEMDPRSDVYSLGAILYQLLTGVAPYSGRSARILPGDDPGGDSAAAVWKRVIKGQLEPLGGLAPDVDGELVAICEKAMQREPGARYANVIALLEDLRAYLERGPIQARKSLARSVSKVSWIVQVAWWGLLLSWGLVAVFLVVPFFLDQTREVQSSFGPTVSVDLHAVDLALQPGIAWIDEVRLEDLRGKLTFVSNNRPVSFLAVGIALAALALVTYVVLQLRGLFATLKQGRPFAPGNVRRIRSIGIVMLLIALGQVAYTAVIGAQVSGLVESSKVDFSVPIDVPWSWIFTGALILILAQVFHIGAEIERNPAAATH